MSKLFPNATIRTSAPYRFDIVGITGCKGSVDGKASLM